MRGGFLGKEAETKSKMTDEIFFLTKPFGSVKGILIFWQ